MWRLIYVETSHKKLSFKDSLPGRAKKEKTVHMQADQTRVARCQNNSAMRKVSVVQGRIKRSFFQQALGSVHAMYQVPARSHQELMHSDSHSCSRNMHSACNSCSERPCKKNFACLVRENKGREKMIRVQISQKGNHAGKGTL